MSVGWVSFLPGYTPEEGKHIPELTSKYFRLTMSSLST
jgi:hypothetical protein